MIDNPLDTLFGVGVDDGASASCRANDGVKKAGKQTRARIEQVFSKQGRITARLRDLHTVHQPNAAIRQN